METVKASEFCLLSPTLVKREAFHEYKPNTMKQLLFTLFFLLGANSNAQDTIFSRIYEPLSGGLWQSVPFSDADVVWDNGLIFTGMDNLQHSYLVRTDSVGNLMWNKTYLSNGLLLEMHLNEVISTSDSSFVAIGRNWNTLNSNLLPYCIKLDQFGDTLWTKSFELINPPVGDYGSFESNNGQLIEMTDSSLLFAFHYNSYGQPLAIPDHICLVNLASDGTLIWSKSFQAPAAFYLTDIEQAVDGSIYLVGMSSQSSESGYILHLSDSGQILWSREYDGITFNDIELDSTHLYLAWLNDFGYSGILKTDLNGDQVKRVRMYVQATSGQVSLSLTRRSNGNFVLAPSYYWDNINQTIVETNSDLNLFSAYGLQMVSHEVLAIPNMGIYAVGFGPLYGVKANNVEVGVIRFDQSMSAAGCVWPETLSHSDEDSVSSTMVSFLSSDSIIEGHLPVQYQNIDFVNENRCVTFIGSVDENEGTWNETVSPNPSTGKFTVSWDAFRDAELIVYNSIGMVVLRSKTKDSFVEIDLQTEQNGLYHYRLIDTQGSQSSGMLMVTN